MDSIHVMFNSPRTMSDPIFLCAEVLHYVWVQVRGSSRLTKHPLKNGRLAISRLGFDRRTQYIKVYRGVVSRSHQ